MATAYASKYNFRKWENLKIVQNKKNLSVSSFDKAFSELWKIVNNNVAI